MARFGPKSYRGLFEKSQTKSLPKKFHRSEDLTARHATEQKLKSLKVIFSPLPWGMVLAAVVGLGLVFLAYLHPVVNAQENLEGLPIAIVNDDRGFELCGEEVDFGDQVAERLTSEDSSASNIVTWKEFESRREAVRQIANNEVYGAIYIPPDYSERIARIVSPPEVTIAVLNEDEGANVGKRETNLGGQVVGRVTSPEASAPQTVGFAEVEP